MNLKCRGMFEGKGRGMFKGKCGGMCGLRVEGYVWTKVGRDM